MGLKAAAMARATKGLWELPEGWEWIRLGDAFSIRSGTVDPTKAPNESFCLYSIPAYDAGTGPELCYGRKIGSAKVIVQRGDILLSKLNPRIPRIWIIDDNTSYRKLASTEFLPLIRQLTADSVPYFDTNFVKILLLSNVFRQQVAQDVQGATGSRQRLQREVVQAALLPMPSSLEAQRRLAARIEALMAEVKRARMLLEQMRHYVGRLMDSVLQEVFDFLSDKSSDWYEESISEFCYKPQYGYTQSASTKPIGPKFLRITDIQDSKVNWESVPYCQISNDQLSKYLLSNGDILFARSGATTGKTFLVRDCPPVVFASYLIRLRIRVRVLPEFLAWFLRSPAYWRQLTLRGAAQPNMNAQLLGQIKVHYPKSQETQLQIISHLDSVQLEVNEMQQKLDQDIKILDQLEQSILERAFRGEL